MAIENGNTYGQKKSNSSWQYNVLKSLKCIIDNTAGGGSGVDYEFRVTTYKANKPGVGYSTNDFISRTDIINVLTGVIISTLWFNETTGLTIAAPPIVDLDPYTPPGSITISNPFNLEATQVLVLAELVAINANTASLVGFFTPVVRTPTYIQATAAGAVAAGARSVSVYNSGTTAGVWLGTAIAPGVQMSFSVSNQGDTLGAFAYTASATATLEITTIV